MVYIYIYRELWNYHCQVASPNTGHTASGLGFGDDSHIRGPSAAPYPPRSQHATLVLSLLKEQRSLQCQLRVPSFGPKHYLGSSDIGIMAKKMETTIVHWGYIGIMENIMETTIVYLDSFRILTLKAKPLCRCHRLFSSSVATQAWILVLGLSGLGLGM